jgi:hypothetical protein
MFLLLQQPWRERMIAEHLPGQVHSFIYVLLPAVCMSTHSCLHALLDCYFPPSLAAHPAQGAFSAGRAGACQHQHFQAVPERLVGG